MLFTCLLCCDLTCSQEIGVGNTCAWKVCGIDPAMTLAVVFEVANQVCVCVCVRVCVRVYSCVCVREGISIPSLSKLAVSHKVSLVLSSSSRSTSTQLVRREYVSLQWLESKLLVAETISLPHLVTPPPPSPSSCSPQLG